MGSGGQGGVIIKFVFSRCGGGSSNLDGGWGHARWLDKKGKIDSYILLNLNEKINV